MQHSHIPYPPAEGERRAIGGYHAQMIKQVLKLQDVVSVRRHGADHEVFVRLEEFFSGVD